MPSNTDNSKRVEAARIRLSELEGATAPKQIDLTVILANGERVTYSGQDKDGWKFTNRVLATSCRGLVEEALKTYRLGLKAFINGTPTPNVAPTSAPADVVITVKRGIAHVKSAPVGLNVRIVDEDMGDRA